MADHQIPHFQNDAGHPAIEIGVKEFMCVGANPPNDHPHVFLDMGADVEKVCPYCSTLYKFNPGAACRRDRAPPAAHSSTRRLEAGLSEDPPGTGAMSAHNIMIIGAGIAGLATALAFARNGHEVDIVDQAHALSEVGAGLQISPNASRVLIALGLGKALAQTMICPQEITLVSGLSLRRITHVPCGAFAAARWGAPYGVMHRADLQAMLLDAVKAEPRCRLHLGHRTEAAAISSLHQRLGRPAPALIVGADGVWSQTRRLVPGAMPPRFFRTGGLAVQDAGRRRGRDLEHRQCHSLSRHADPSGRLSD